MITNIVAPIKVKTIIRHKTVIKSKVKYKKQYKGIDIDNFNKELRKKLVQSKKFLFELYNEEGVFYTSNAKKGFDFASIDCQYNAINLWNICFGRRALNDGHNHWKRTLKDNEFIKDVVKQEGYGSQSFIQGENQIAIKNSLTILGELQFGNWGLAYRDLFKLLHADTNSGVDLFVYVTADKKLLDYASDGIVSYDKTIEILNEFSNLIKVPIWVIGLDLDVL